MTAFDAATSFDAATAVVAADAGCYDATLSETWAIGPRPHGGYQLSVLGRAARAAVAAHRDDEAHPDPQATSAVFLHPPSFGRATVEVEILRAGRSASHAQATLVQDGRVCARSLHVFGRLSGEPLEPFFTAEPAPAMPPFEQSGGRPPPPPMPDGSVLRVGIAEVVEMRFDPDTLAEGGTGEAELRGWLRFTDGRDADTLSLLFAVDALPPVTFNLGAPGWVPTLELTAYVRGIPAPGRLRVRQRARVISGSMVDQVCEVWDSRDRIVAQATQLALVRMPPA
jgi:hypothetical protein